MNNTHAMWFEGNFKVRRGLPAVEGRGGGHAASGGVQEAGAYVVGPRPITLASRSD